MAISSTNRLRQRGQGMSEYLIIVALIAIAAIGVVGAMGGVVQNQVAGMANELAGNDAAAERAGAVAQSGNAAAEAAAGNNNLSNYSNAGNTIGQ